MTPVLPRCHGPPRQRRIPTPSLRPTPHPNVPPSSRPTACLKLSVVDAAPTSLSLLLGHDPIEGKPSQQETDIDGLPETKPDYPDSMGRNPSLALALLHLHLQGSAPARHRGVVVLVITVKLHVNEVLSPHVEHEVRPVDVT